MSSEPDPVKEIDPAELRGLFRAPGWLRDLGVASWLLIGVLLFLAGMVWLLALTETIVLPVLTASILAAVASPLVAWLARHRVPRGHRRRARPAPDRGHRRGDADDDRRRPRGPGG